MIQHDGMICKVASVVVNVMFGLTQDETVM